MDEYAEEKRTEKNLIVRSGISEAKTTNNKRLDYTRLSRARLCRDTRTRERVTRARTTINRDYARRFVLKLYIHVHEASRGLFATAELLVLMSFSLSSLLLLRYIQDSSTS